MEQWYEQRTVASRTSEGAAAEAAPTKLSKFSELSTAAAPK
jgi:hypothetical protein